MDAPPVIAPAPSRFSWLLAGGLMLAAVAAGAVYFLFDPAQYHFYPRCMFHAVTGLECPGCGSQRAVYQLLHGHVVAAFRYNALLVLGLPVLAFGLVRFALNWAADGTMPAINISPRWIKFAAGVLIVFGILRNIPCAPFTYLAPP
jgi:Protein of unknown function (DUF2752)